MEPSPRGESSHTLLISILVLVVLGVGAAWWWGSSSNIPGADNPENPDKNATVVMMTPDGFEPKAISVSAGTTVVFLDRDSTGMWVASDAHPTHEGYAGTDTATHCPDVTGTAFDQCAEGPRYGFTFRNTGTWKYHNHLHPEMTGTVTVTE